MRDLLRPFYAAIAAGRPPAVAGTASPYPTIEDGARGVAFVEAVLESSRRGTWAALETPLRAG
jgi:hypothetical protein